MLELGSLVGEIGLVDLWVDYLLGDLVVVEMTHIREIVVGCFVLTAASERVLPCVHVSPNRNGLAAGQLELESVEQRVADRPARRVVEHDAGSKRRYGIERGGYFVA